jgi:hypothetical protein
MLRFSSDAWGRECGPRFTINLKRSTHNLQLSTNRTADYPIYGSKGDIPLALSNVRF